MLDVGLAVNPLFGPMDTTQVDSLGLRQIGTGLDCAVAMLRFRETIATLKKGRGLL